VEANAIRHGNPRPTPLTPSPSLLEISTQSEVLVISYLGVRVMTLFRVETALVDGVERVSLEGELDRAGFVELELALLAADGRPVVVDLSDCDFIDSSAIALLVEHWRRMDGRLFLAGAKSQTARILQITGIGENIRMFESLEEASSALAGDEKAEASSEGNDWVRS
jgi:anti-anti-sigma factor